MRGGEAVPVEGVERPQAGVLEVTDVCFARKRKEGGLLGAPAPAQYSTVQYNTIQYNTIQYNTAQHSTAQHNTIQYNTIL